VARSEPEAADFRPGLTPYPPKDPPMSRDTLCSDCPPVGYPTDDTRCAPCPRRQPVEGGGVREALSLVTFDLSRLVARRNNKGLPEWHKQSWYDRAEKSLAKARAALTPSPSGGREGNIKVSGSDQSGQTTCAGGLSGGLATREAIARVIDTEGWAARDRGRGPMNPPPLASQLARSLSKADTILSLLQREES
jgi:hypothetical protein